MAGSHKEGIFIQMGDKKNIGKGRRIGVVTDGVLHGKDWACKLLLFAQKLEAKRGLRGVYDMLRVILLVRVSRTHLVDAVFSLFVLQ